MGNGRARRSGLASFLGFRLIACFANDAIDDRESKARVFDRHGLPVFYLGNAEWLGTVRSALVP